MRAHPLHARRAKQRSERIAAEAQSPHLPAVLRLWQYVLGEDVKGGLENVRGWIVRMLEDERVLAGVGGTCAGSAFQNALYLFPLGALSCFFRRNPVR